MRFTSNTCLVLALAAGLAAFAGCKSEEEATATPAPATEGEGGGAGEAAEQLAAALTEGLDEALDELTEAAEAVAAEAAEAVEAAAETTEEATEEPPEPTWEEKIAASAPLTPTPAPQTQGDITLTAVACTTEGHAFLHDSNMRIFQDIVHIGDHLYIVNHAGHVLRFGMNLADGCVLTLDTTWGEGGALELPREAKSISRLSDTRLVASTGVFGSYVVNTENGEVAYTCDTRPQGYVRVSPNGDFGLGSFVSAEIARLTFTDSGCSAEVWEHNTPLAGVNFIGFAGDLILAGGRLEEEHDGRQPTNVVAFNAAGEEVWRQGNLTSASADDGYGWVHGLDPCSQGICVIDSNFRSLHILDLEGNHLGKFNLSNLFDMRYPWIAAMSHLGDGRALFSAANTREQLESHGGGRSDVNEGIIYLVSGL